MLSDISTQLGNFDFLFEFSFKACKQNLPLSRLKSIHDARDAAAIVSDREVDQLLMDEILVSKPLHVVVHKYVHVVVGEPQLTFVRQIFHKCKMDGIDALRILLLKLNHVFRQI
jgi:hypothetical protein